MTNLSNLSIKLGLIKTLVEKLRSFDDHTHPTPSTAKAILLTRQANEYVLPNIAKALKRHENKTEQVEYQKLVKMQEEVLDLRDRASNRISAAHKNRSQIRYERAVSLIRDMQNSNNHTALKKYVSMLSNDITAYLNLYPSNKNQQALRNEVNDLRKLFFYNNTPKNRPTEAKQTKRSIFKACFGGRCAKKN